jgi:uncharacterized protein YjbI with pentapeptide repeats
MAQLMDAERVGSCRAADKERAPDRPPWLCQQYRLALREKLLVRDPTSPVNVNALRGVSAVVANDPSIEDSEKQAALSARRNKALDEILRLDMRNRHLRGADFSQAVLPKANLIWTQLQGVDLWRAQLQGAHLWGAQLQGANLKVTQLEDADLSWAQLQGADLRQARLRGAGLWRTQLERANLQEAQLEAANMTLAQLRGANLSQARLQGADLSQAGLQDADLWGAELQGANLRFADLRGADLRSADLRWTDLTAANLSFANFAGVRNLETAELAGADYVFTDGLEGTFLDINQPPPDVLPASCDPCSISLQSAPLDGWGKSVRSDMDRQRKVAPSALAVGATTETGW